MTKPNRSCGWCHKPLTSAILRPREVYCSTGCRDADALFKEMMSDEEINRRIHYTKLTRGKDEDH